MVFRATAAHDGVFTVQGLGCRVGFKNLNVLFYRVQGS